MTIYIQFNKVFFNIVKVLIESIECFRRSGKFQVGSTAEEIVVLVALRKKYFTWCQILLSKIYLYTF